MVVKIDDSHQFTSNLALWAGQIVTLALHEKKIVTVTNFHWAFARERSRALAWEPKKNSPARSETTSGNVALA
jgi:hypothetical protein